MTLDALSIEEHTLASTSMKNKTAANPLRTHVREALTQYFEKLDGHGTSGLYQMVIAEVEQPLLETVMEHTGGNQSRAAKLLGISRCTLRKKLAQYDLD